jgi:subtilisin family serine protease
MARWREILNKQIHLPLTKDLHHTLKNNHLWYRAYHENTKSDKIHLALFLIASLLFLTIIFPYSRPEVSGVEIRDREQQISSNKIIVKLKNEAKPKVKIQKNGALNPEDTGLPELNDTNKKVEAAKVEKTVKSGKNSNKGNEIFDYYTITLSAPEGIIFLSEGEDLKAKAEKNKSSNTEKKLLNAWQEYQKNTHVESVETVKIVSNAAIPNDYYYSRIGSWGQSYDDLWGLKKIKAAEGWDTTTGSSSLVVAVIDTGVDTDHEDLAANIWNNDGENGLTESDDICWSGAPADKKTNNCDDDDNGYLDDWRGYDFSTVEKAEDNDPADGHGHGTHVAGTVAAVGNNATGIVGVGWNTKIMALKGLSDGGEGYDVDLATALVYAADNGAKVVNNSWVGYGSSSIINAAIDYAHDTKGVTLIAAAGNEDDDTSNYFPAANSKVITVSATNHLDGRAAFSNYGTKLDVAAPGGDSSGWGGINSYILSTCSSTGAWACDVGVNYTTARGTSMSAPHVSGLAALLLANSPTMTNETIRERLRSTADDMGTTGKDIYFGYGRINAYKALNNIVTTPPPPPAKTPVYRFFNRKKGTHFYTASLAEKNRVIALWSSTFRYEGVAYNLNYSSGRNTAPLYRFFNVRNGTHFFTASLAEKNNVIAKWSSTYRYEGVAWYVSNSSSSSFPVYRFFNRKSGTHFYTASVTEKNRVISLWSSTYRYEGPVFFIPN